MLLGNVMDEVLDAFLVAGEGVVVIKSIHFYLKLEKLDNFVAHN